MPLTEDEFPLAVQNLMGIAHDRNFTRWDDLSLWADQQLLKITYNYEAMPTNLLPLVTRWGVEAEAVINATGNVIVDKDKRDALLQTFRQVRQNVQAGGESQNLRKPFVWSDGGPWRQEKKHGLFPRWRKRTLRLWRMRCVRARRQTILYAPCLPSTTITLRNLF